MLVPFSSGGLRDKIAELSQSEPSQVGEYLDDYALQLGCKAIVVEKDYIDGDYLDDFASYYSRCFRGYPRHCSRLHLFSTNLTRQLLDSALLNRNADDVKSVTGAYLGFIVVRPLRNAAVGRTVLRTYPPDEDRRSYPVLRSYDVSLFGLSLSVDSIAYQQQDSVVAACATVSLWCAFHKTAQLFHSQLPRPAEITRVASRASSPGRVFPNHGLDLRQICDAVRAVGLEPELFSVRTGTYLQSMVYAHLAAGIPVVVCAHVEGEDHHAFTITGCSILDVPHASPEVSGSSVLPMSGRRIDALYVHDDQIGPFARLDIRRGAVDGEDRTYFTGTWKASDGSFRRIVPWAIVVPVYNKIRVNFVDIQSQVLRLHELFGALAANVLGSECEWSIRLITVNDYKGRVRENPKVVDAEKEAVLLSPQPKFIWKVNLGIDGATALQVLGDATGVRDALPFYKLVWYSQDFKLLLRHSLASLPRPMLLGALGRPLLEFLEAQVAA